MYGASPNLVDLDRIEILRGPQGTLFGRNTQAGAVSIVPNRPVFDETLSGKGEAGTDGYGVAQIVGNATVVPGRLAARLALSYATFGGDIPNVAAGGTDGGLDRHGESRARASYFTAIERRSRCALRRCPLCSISSRADAPGRARPFDRTDSSGQREGVVSVGRRISRGNAGACGHCRRESGEF